MDIATDGAGAACCVDWTVSHLVPSDLVVFSTGRAEHV